MNKFRIDIFYKIKDFCGIPDGEIQPTYLNIIFSFLFPLNALNIYMNKQTGFDMQRNCWKIHDGYYSDELFYHLSKLPEGSELTIKKSNGLFHITPK